MSDAEELAYYRDINQKALADPEARGLLLALRKKIYPNTSIPEYDIPEKLKTELETELKKRDEELERYKTEQANKEFAADYERRKSALSGQYRFSEDDLKKVEALVVEEHFPTLETAARYYSEISEPIKPGGLGLLGLSQSKGSLEVRKEFNDRYRKLFKRAGSKGREVLSEAMDKVKSGEYLNEIR